MLTLATSGIFAALERADSNHAAAKAVLGCDSEPLIVPTGILAEVGCLVEARLGTGFLDAFMADLEDGSFTVECGLDHLARARALVKRYRDMPLGVADALVIACAERHRGRVLTLDERHFRVVAAEGAIEVVGAGATA